MRLPRSSLYACALVAAASMMTGCDLLSSTHRLRYRLIVTVQTPQGTRTGSSVIEIAESESTGLNGGWVHSEVKGQAAAVDLPDGTTVYALLRGVDGLRGAYASAALEPLLPSATVKGGDITAYLKAMGAQQGTHDVPADHSPLMAYFTDKQNPSSAVVIDPKLSGSVKGSTYRISGVKISITNNALSSDIIKRLPWLSRDANQPIVMPHSMFDHSAVGSLTAGDFLRRRSLL